MKAIKYIITLVLLLVINFSYAQVVNKKVTISTSEISLPPNQIAYGNADSSLTSSDNFTFDRVTGNVTIGQNLFINPSGASQAIITRYENNPFSNEFVTRKARGTRENPAAVQEEDILGGLEFYAYDGTNWDIAGRLIPFAYRVNDDDYIDSRLRFEVGRDSLNTPYVPFEILPEGLILKGKIWLNTQKTLGIFTGTGSPEGVLSADVGSTFHRTDGGAGTSYYVKESGTGNTGWVATVAPNIPSVWDTTISNNGTSDITSSQVAAILDNYYQANYDLTITSSAVSNLIINLPSATTYANRKLIINCIDQNVNDNFKIQVSGINEWVIFEARQTENLTIESQLIDGSYVWKLTSDLDLYTGWERIVGNDYTFGSPLVILQGDTATLSINGNSSLIRTHLPAGVDSLWNRATNKIMPVKTGDSYELRIDFKAETSVPSGGYAQVMLDIGGSVGNVLNHLIIFPKGANTPHTFSITSSIYTLDTFLLNGGQIKVYSESGDTDIYDVAILITKIHHGQN